MMHEAHDGCPTVSTGCDSTSRFTQGASMAKIKPKNIHRFIKPYVVTSGKKFRLKDYDPGDTHHLNSEDKPEAKEILTEGVRMLADLQEILYAQSNWGLLLVFQAMDAAGKDG